MAGPFSNLGDPEAYQGLPLPASPVSGSGEDPDEMREMLAQRAALRGQQMGASMAQASPVAQVPDAQGQPAAMRPAPQPGGPPTSFEPAGFNAEVARRSMTGQLGAGQRLTETADQMQADPQIAALEQQKMQDEASTPNAKDPNYRPGFGTRLVRGLRGVGLGLAEHGISGAILGGIDPGLVAGGKAYGAPTDAYDIALAKNQRQVGQDTEALSNAQSNFKTAQELREKRLGGFKDSGEAFKGAGTTATTQESEENKAAQLPIDQTKADADAKKAFNESPEGKLQVKQSEIDARTKLADTQRMPQGFMRTRYILTGEVQPGREPTAEEIAVNRILRTWPQEHPGTTGPKTVAEWQGVYSAAKGGTAAGTGESGKNLRDLAGVARKRVDDLQAVMRDRGAVLWSPEQKAQHQRELDDATAQLNDVTEQLKAASEPAAAAPGAPAPAGGGNPQPAAGGGPHMPAGATNGQLSPDGKFVVQNGTMVKATGADGMVRMKVPDPAHPGQFRYARFAPEKAPQAARLGAQFAGLQGQ